MARGQTSPKAQWRDKAEARGITHYDGKPLSRLNLRELQSAVYEHDHADEGDDEDDDGRVLMSVALEGVIEDIDAHLARLQERRTALLAAIEAWKEHEAHADAHSGR